MNTAEPDGEPTRDTAQTLELSLEGSTVIGLLAYAELAAQMRLAIDASRAPRAQYRLAQADLSGAAHVRLRKLISYLDGALLDGEPLDGEAQVRAFNDAFDDYEQRTKAETWHERVLKGYVGHSVSVDFCRVLTRTLPQDVRDYINDSLSLANETEVAMGILTNSTAEDSVLASRLALWGRRLVGEALNQIQQLLHQYSALGALALASARADGVELVDAGYETNSKAVTSWVFAQLTADHARRMDRIGLAS